MTTLMIPPPGPWNSCQDRILIALADRQPHHLSELSRPEVGGFEATRRIRELRTKGWTIERKGLHYTLVLA